MTRRKSPRNTTFSPKQTHESSTYGEEQAERVRRSARDRKAAGIIWHDRPSERFDWDAALIRVQAMLDSYEEDK